MVNPGNRIPMRAKSTGSVRMLMPKKLMRTVAWPIHAAVTWSSFHLKGSGLAKAGKIGRQLSIVHSRQRFPIQRLTRLLCRVGCSGVCIRGSESKATSVRRPLARSEQTFERFPKSPDRLRRTCACDEDGNICTIQNAAGQIAHDVMPEQTARLGGAGHD
jgi:hypothetical protein